MTAANVQVGVSEFKFTAALSAWSPCDIIWPRPGFDILRLRQCLCSRSKFSEENLASQHPTVLWKGIPCQKQALDYGPLLLQKMFKIQLVEHDHPKIASPYHSCASLEKRLEKNYPEHWGSTWRMTETLYKLAWSGSDWVKYKSLIVHTAKRQSFLQHPDPDKEIAVRISSIIEQPLKTYTNEIQCSESLLSIAGTMLDVSKIISGTIVTGPISFASTPAKPVPPMRRKETHATRRLPDI